MKTLLGLASMVLYAFSVLAWNVVPSTEVCRYIAAAEHRTQRACSSRPQTAVPPHGRHGSASGQA